MIIFFKNIKKIGGPSSFQKKFIEWLKKNKIEYDFLKKNNIFKKKILFINSGTFNILLLFISSLYKTKIIQRLNGFYDLKKVKNKYYLRCFLINFSMQLIRKYLSNTKIQLINIDDYGFDGDFIESQAFAFLAIRSLKGMPISFPNTTRCKKSVTGGVLVENF